tara:strand:+ start:1239 stop:1763 length:525 start_codon:yes stop_codon:yes gene_type:complete
MLPAPTLKFQGNHKAKVLKTKDSGLRGSWNLSGSKFLEPRKKFKLGFIKFGQFTNNEIITFADQLQPALRSYGYEVNWDNQNKCFGYGIVDGGSTDNDGQSSSTNIINAYRGLDVGTSLLIFVLDYKDISAYSNIKWWAECSVGKANICLTRGVINKKKKNSSDADPNMLANLR